VLDVSGPSNDPLTAMPQTALSELARSNPRYLTPAEKRLLQGLYPQPSTSVFTRAREDVEAANLPRLRTLPELSDDERAHALAHARAGASVNALVRGFCLTRWAAFTLHREGRPQPEPEPAPQPEPPGTRAREPAVTLAPERRPQPECTHEPAPAPARESAPAVTPEPKRTETTVELVARLNAQAGVPQQPVHAPRNSAPIGSAIATLQSALRGGR